MPMRDLLAAFQSGVGVCAHTRLHRARLLRLAPRRSSARRLNLPTPRLSVRPHPVLVCLAAVGYSAGLRPVSLARVCLACYSGTDFLVGWLASLQSSACYYKSFWS